MFSLIQRVMWRNPQVLCGWLFKCQIKNRKNEVYVSVDDIYGNWLHGTLNCGTIKTAYTEDWGASLGNGGWDASISLSQN